MGNGDKLLLKSWHTNSVIHHLTPSELHHRGNSLKSIRDMQEGTKSTNFRTRAGGSEVEATLSRKRSTDRCQCSLVDTAGPMQVGAKFVPSINLANTVHLALVIP